MELRKNNYITSAWLNLIQYILTNPKKSIVLLAGVAAIVSCYPVVFFGKSFISVLFPGYLYPHPPFLPGLADFLPRVTTDLFGANNRGSDVGAAAWLTIPDTIVQYVAIMKDFEFPFWTRYVAGGSPLFAQGQSMLGDILHWIPLFFGGSALGWDIKFILAKTIFASGMGLLVFRLTKHCLASLLVAISSCFLGFFAYRLNHPVFFVLTYAPWIILQWDQLGELFASTHPKLRNCLMQGFLLVFISWLELNAGGPKEGVVTACFMHILGVIFFIDQVRCQKGWLKSIMLAIGLSIIILMATSFHWLLFLDALSKSYTFYDHPAVITFPFWKIIGFFDNYFLQQIDGNIGVSSTNLFVLFGLCCSVVALQANKTIRIYSVWVMFILVLSIAYGLVSKNLFLCIPFINNIHHLGDAVSMPMMIFSLVLSGFGMKYFLDANPESKKIIVKIFLMVFTSLIILYLFAVNNIPNARLAYLGIVIFLLIIFFSVKAILEQTKSSAWSASLVVILMSCFLLLHIRHGMHLMTKIKLLDQYLIIMAGRPNFANKSTAIEYVKKQIAIQKTPVRVLGVGAALFPGYNSSLGLEGVVSVESLRNKYYEELLDNIGYPRRIWGWLRLINSKQASSLSAALDMLNVGYMVAAVGTKAPKDMQLIHSSDLAVWRRDTVWPRAFFVNQVIKTHKETDIAIILAKMPHIPFATVESQRSFSKVHFRNCERFLRSNSENSLKPMDYRDTKSASRNGETMQTEQVVASHDWIATGFSSDYKVIPATQYLLTNNTTKFTVNATGPGIIVLGEAYYPEDFIATMNGKRVNYIRVNNAFKGVWVDKAGSYEVIFTYRPAKLYQAIILSLGGLLFLPIFVIVFLRLKFNRKLKTGR